MTEIEAAKTAFIGGLLCVMVMAAVCAGCNKVVRINNDTENAPAGRTGTNSWRPSGTATDTDSDSVRMDSVADMNLDTGTLELMTDSASEGVNIQSTDSDPTDTQDLGSVTVVDTGSGTDGAVACEYNGHLFDVGAQVPIETCKGCSDACECQADGSLAFCTGCECLVGACDLDGEFVGLNNTVYRDGGCTECTCGLIAPGRTALRCSQVPDCASASDNPVQPGFTETVAEICAPGTWVKGTDATTGLNICATCPLNSTSHTDNAVMCVPKRFVDIGVGNGPICGLYEDGGVQCWAGTTTYESDLVPGNGGDFTKIAVGGSFACALNANGRLTCWGSSSQFSEYVDMSLISGGNFEKVYAAPGYVCGLKADGTARCFGGLTISLLEIFPPVNIAFESLALGNTHLCGLLPDGMVKCYCDDDGNCGMPDGGPFQQIVAGDDFTCGLKSSGTVECWPAATDMNRDISALSFPVDESFTQLTAGGDSVCGLRLAGTVECWGDDFYGELYPPAHETFTQISLGSRNGCGLKANGTVECWGDDTYAALDVPGTRAIDQMWGGAFTVCIRYLDGAFACWNGIFEGGGEFSLPDDVQFVNASVSSTFSCGIRDDGTASCWGNLAYAGEWFAPDTLFRQIDVNAGRCVCAVLSNGTIECRGTAECDLTGTPSGAGFVALSMARCHGCGLREDGSVECWGHEDEAVQPLPPDGVTFTHLASGRDDTCGI
ncbi:MAG: hypothetical protein JXX14_15365, partial [Deltaproteobacteria bacterium]|nr:hypothetical protein [Deltaproteobacteria bacterium]